MTSENSLRRLPRNVWVMSATSLLNDISSEMLLNILAFFLANILAVRKRKPFTVIGYSLSAFSKPLLYFAIEMKKTISNRCAIHPSGVQYQRHDPAHFSGVKTGKD